jgi:hypothetical protein
MILYPRAGYDDLRITAFEPRTSAPVLADFSTTPASYVLQAWSFANNGTERGLQGVTQIPHGWFPGDADADVHLHLSSTGALAEGVVAGFFVSLIIQKTGQALADAYTKLLFLGKTVPVGGYGAKTHIMTSTFTIPAANLWISAMVFAHVFRKKGTEITTDNLGAVTEAVDDVLWLHELDLHVKRSNFGTRTPTA